VHVVVERSRAKSALALLGCAGFVYVSLAILTVGSATSFVIGILGVLTFTVFGIGWLTLLLRRGPGLVVDDEGLDDRASLVAVGRVPWSDVTGVGSWGAFGTSFVVVRVREPSEYLRRVTPLLRPAAWLNRSLVGSTVTIPSTGLRIGAGGLLALVHEGFQRHRQPLL